MRGCKFCLDDRSCANCTRLAQYKLKLYDYSKRYTLYARHLDCTFCKEGRTTFKEVTSFDSVKTAKEFWENRPYGVDFLSYCVDNYNPNKEVEVEIFDSIEKKTISVFQTICSTMWRDNA